MLPLHHTRFESCVVSDWLELVGWTSVYEGMTPHSFFSQSTVASTPEPHKCNECAKNSATVQKN